MPGLGLSGHSGGSLYGGMSRPGLSRSLSMHPDQEVELSFVEEEGEEEAQLEGGAFSSSCPTPYEALSLSWPADDHPQQEPSRPASPSPLDQTPDQEHALAALPPALPLLPPIETAPLGGPLTRSFSQFLQNADSKYFRPINGATLKPTAAATSAPKSYRRIVPNAVPSTPATSSRNNKRPRTTESLASTSAPAPPPATAPVLAGVVPAPRKKRRGMRPGTYMCLYKGELYECPHGCDIVEKGLLYDLLRR